MFLSDPAQGVCMPEGNIADRVLASGRRSPGVEGPFTRHNMSAGQPVRSPSFLFERTSMPDKLKKQGRQITAGKSDRCILPSKPGNSGGGKAATPVRELTWTLTGHRAGCWVRNRAARSVLIVRKCWWGAGCVNGARPVLRGGNSQLTMVTIL